jgi:hypothetical protein
METQMKKSAFLIVLSLLSGCSHKQFKNEATLHSICFDNRDYAGKKVTLQVTAVKTASHFQFSFREEARKYYCIRIDDGSGGHAGDDFYAYFPKTTFSKDRDEILGFKGTKITIVGYVTIAPEADILIESYNVGWGE